MNSGDRWRKKELRRFWVPPEQRTSLRRVHPCRGDSASPGQEVSVCAGAGDEKKRNSFTEERHGKNLNQGRPVPSVRGRTEATKDERYQRAANHRPMWDFDPVMHAYVTSPDLDRLIARRHGTRPGPHDMNDASRTAGCPAAERKTRTEPTGGASPGFAPWGVEAPLAQLRHPGRAVPLRRRRTVRDDFLGREGKPSQSLLRKVQRQTLYTCLVQLACGVDARIPNESLAPVRRASSAMSNEKNWIIQSRSGVRPLDFRDHIPVRQIPDLALLTGRGPTASPSSPRSWTPSSGRFW
jgi:hypothetical protein